MASRDAEYPLTLEGGTDVTPIPGDVPELVATWITDEGGAPEATPIARYLGGGAVMLVLLGLGLLLTTRDRHAPRAAR